MTALLIAALACAAWIYLLLFRGGFWRNGEHADAGIAVIAPHTWPPVVAVIPARNEAEVIAATVGSLLRHDYPGRFEVVVVDDHSTDGTAAMVREAAAVAGAAGRTHLLAAPAAQHTFGVLKFRRRQLYGTFNAMSWAWPPCR